MTFTQVGYRSRRGHLEQGERRAHRVVYAHHSDHVEQTLPAEGLLGLTVQLVADAVTGGKLAREACCDLLVIAQVRWDAAINKRGDGLVRQAGFARHGTLSVELIIGTPDGAYRDDHHFAYALRKGGVGRLGGLKLRKLRRHLGVQKEGVERTD